MAWGCPQRKTTLPPSDQLQLKFSYAEMSAHEQGLEAETHCVRGCCMCNILGIAADTTWREQEWVECRNNCNRTVQEIATNGFTSTQFIYFSDMVSFRTSKWRGRNSDPLVANILQPLPDRR
eukprot:1442182-Rhodomonas_salina.2